MGGDQGQNKQNQITDQQLGVEKSYLDMAQTQLKKQETLTAPLESYNKDIIDSGKSGDYSTLISAAGVPIKNITQLNKQANESIMTNIPAGAGRDAALANAKLGESSDIATALNQLFSGAMKSQASLGAEAAGIGLQESGAALNAGGQASSSNQALMSANEQGKASTMDFLGSLAGAGGTMAATKMCWIAEAVYGVDSEKTRLVRMWLNGPYRETRVGHVVTNVYILIGRQVAWFVRRSSILRALFKPLFDLALKRAVLVYGKE